MAQGRRVVLLTGHPEVRAVVLRLAALAGAEVEVIASSSGVRGAWRAAAQVIVGADLAAAASAAGLPRRSGVAVVALAEPEQAVWRSAIDLGAVRLVVLPADEPVLLDLLSEAVDAPPAGGTAIAVVGGCGGAGASTMAAALALTSARVSPTLLIDGDRLGGGVDVLLGIETVSGARWPDLVGTRGRLSTAALADALPTAGGCSVLSWDRSGGGPLDAAAADAVVDAGLRGFERVVIDLPRYVEAGSADLTIAIDAAVIVVPATVRATAAAAAVAAGLLGRCGRTQLVVRDAGSGRLTADQVSDALGLPVVAAVRSESAVSTAADRGELPIRRGRGSLAAACRDVLAEFNDAPVAA